MECRPENTAGRSFTEIVAGREMISDSEFLYLLRDAGKSCAARTQAVYRKLLDDPSMLEYYDYISSAVAESLWCKRRKDIKGGI